MKRPSLGKGLSALLEDSSSEISSAARVASGNAALAGTVINLSITQIEINPFQPRSEFDKQALKELSQSIKSYGLIQPITVRKVSFNKFQIISGERRFRASQLAGLEQIPAYVRIANDKSMLEMALVENIQRRDLNALETALAYKRLIDECDLTQEQLSFKVGQERSTVTNFLRLLKLPEPIQAALRDRRISMGHARALLSIEKPEVQMRVFQDLLKQELSVRSLEDIAKEYSTKSRTPSKKQGFKSSSALSFEDQKLLEDLQDHFKTNITIRKDNNGEGNINIHFKSDRDLKRITGIFDL